MTSDKHMDKHFDFLTAEKTLRQAWESSDVYACGQTRAASHGGTNPLGNAQPFTIMMPPPNVTGRLHMGHALQNTLQDTLIRFNRMNGRDALWQAGTDHAGIATQMQVEKLLASEGTSRRELGRAKFLERVWSWKEKYGGEIIEQSKQMGSSADWSRSRFTMDDGLSAAVRQTFVKLYEDGLIYRAKRLVNWDPVLQTAVSDLEVEATETKGKIWQFLYPFADGSEGGITVATTRPETLFGDVAVAVHPDDERYKHLVGKKVRVPFVNREIPIIADEYPDPEKGTGAVKMTPAHDFNDFQVGQRHNLPMINVLDSEARVNDVAPAPFAGLSREKARKEVVAAMEALGLLVDVQDHVAATPLSQRSGVPVEPWLTDQWYVDAAKLAGPAMDAVRDGRTKLVPDHHNKIYFNWLENIQPWCVSRQLWWGHQLPIWYGPDDTVFCAMDDADAHAQAEAKFGKPVELRQDEDVLDTWFSSGIWAHGTLGWPEKTPELARYYPTDVLVTGHDLIFFWVARMMMMSLYFTGEVPFKQVFFTPIVLDEKGQKMTKSKGNVVDPVVLMDKYGTDAVRFSLAAMTVQGRNIPLSTSRIEGYRNFGTKLWNAARFCEMNGALSAKVELPTTITQGINQWILAQLNQTIESMTLSLQEFRFADAATSIYTMIWQNFCDWYVELIKPLLQENADAAVKAETQKVVNYVLRQMIGLLHPIMPFVTEGLYQAIYKSGAADDLLAASTWPQIVAVNADKVGDVQAVVDCITALRTLRTDLNVNATAQLNIIVDKKPQWLVQYEPSISRMVKVASVVEGVAAEKSAQVPLKDVTLSIPMADLVDVAKETARLQKQIDTLGVEQTQISARLDNHEFVAKAPADVIDIQRARLAEAAEQTQKLQQALTQLKNLG